MRVEQLIELLRYLPGKAEVGIISDGGYGQDLGTVYMSQRGVVMVAPAGEVVYHDHDRPANAPSMEKVPFWETPG